MTQTPDRPDRPSPEQPEPEQDRGGQRETVDNRITGAPDPGQPGQSGTE